jgi:hypothetical protein
MLRISTTSECSEQQERPTLLNLTTSSQLRLLGTLSIISQQEVIGFINGSKSKVLHPRLPHGVPDLTGSLINEDIDGTKTGTVGNKHIKSTVLNILHRHDHNLGIKPTHKI